MALLNASLESACPSAIAPNLVISNSRLGKTGAFIRARIAGNCDQGSSTVGNHSGTASRPNPGRARSGVRSIAAPPATSVLKKSRRLDIDLWFLFCRYARGGFPLPGGIINSEKFRGCVSVPAIAVTPFVFDFGNAVLDDAVSSAKDGPVTFDLIEPGPQRRGIGIVDDHPVKTVQFGRIGFFNPPNPM